MHFADALTQRSLWTSFEFFPPRTAPGWTDLFATISHFEALHPTFVSVTYGAGGSTRDNTHDLVVRLRRETKLDPMPHLTCVGHTEADILHLLERYAQAGVSNILALRGDPPKGMAAAEGSYRYAAQLVNTIRQCGARVGHPDPRGFGVGVAGFPEGHPQTPNTLVQMDHLKAKVDAGGQFVITQLFFDNHAFMDWRERCALAGIKVPIIAGIMPITTVAGLKRMAELAAGTRFPAPLLRAVARCQDDPESVANVGIHWATEQCRDLLDRGVDGIHLYTLNKSDATQRIYRTLGLTKSAGIAQA
ncbi:MAG: methylenetetrahydrofolate reductase [NAD(P)H] [Phycisphaerales bacterium]